MPKMKRARKEESSPRSPGLTKEPLGVDHCEQKHAL